MDRSGDRGPRAPGSGHGWTRSTARNPIAEDPAMKFFSKFIRNEDGQDMIEYALLAAFISIVAILTIRNIGPMINTIYQRIQTSLT
jgi:Flp pilus assembly pilin Flp